MLGLRAKPTGRSVAGDVSYATLTSCVVVLDKVDSTGRLLRLPPQRCLLGVAQTGSSQVANYRHVLMREAKHQSSMEFSSGVFKNAQGCCAKNVYQEVGG